eukprot:jgi/Tetstr1/438339/TSEL_026906.t1
MVLLVDCSGSMRKADVAGSPSRTHAVYTALVRDLIQPQVELSRNKALAKATVVSVVEMRSEACVMLNRAPLDHHLLEWLRKRADHRAASHGNYLPALDVVIALLLPDAAKEVHLFVMMLRDGAPSDHLERACVHGIQVWQPDPCGGVHFRSGRPRLAACQSASVCRNDIMSDVEKACLAKVKRLGDLFGRERVVFSTVAFGPEADDYHVLRAMAGAMPRSSFQKLGLSADNFTSALSSLTSSMTGLRTATGSSIHSLTERALEKQKDAERARMHLSDTILASHGWDIYLGNDVVYRACWSLEKRGWQPFAPQTADRGLAVAQSPFANGAERFVYSCVNVVASSSVDPTGKQVDYVTNILHGMENLSLGVLPSEADAHSGDCNRATSIHQDAPMKRSCRIVSEWLVAKETKHRELLRQGRKFHEKFCQTLEQARDWAQRFNSAVALAAGKVGAAVDPAFEVHFVACELCGLRDDRYPGGVSWVAVEAELEGRFLKWNNNNGRVHLPDTRQRTGSAQDATAPAASGTTRIYGIIEEEEEEEEEVDDGHTAPAPLRITAQDVPQAFSHFTHFESGGTRLVCYLQGVWNSEDGYLLTDPVIHAYSKSGHHHQHGQATRGYAASTASSRATPATPCAVCWSSRSRTRCFYSSTHRCKSA